MMAIMIKLIYVRNNFGVEDTKDPGALPGDLEEKLRPFLGTTN